MSTAPLRLNGATFKRDKTGLVRMVVPWEVYSVEDCESFTPAELPLGLPITDRDAEEFEVGTWRLTLTHEGQSGDGEVSFESSGAIEVELDTSMAQDPLKSHPNWDVIAARYGWNSPKEEFAETLPSTAGSQTGLSGSKKARRNPLHGVDSYLAVGALFRLTFTTRNAPANILDDLGTVVALPPGWGLLRIPAPRGRNWLKLPPRVRVVGNTTVYSPEYMMSGPNGWIRDIYGAAQLARGAKEVGLTSGGLSTGSL